MPTVGSKIMISLVRPYEQIKLNKMIQDEFIYSFFVNHAFASYIMQSKTDTMVWLNHEDYLILSKYATSSQADLSNSRK